MAGQRRRLTVFDRSMTEIRLWDGGTICALVRSLKMGVGHDFGQYQSA
jgi:hypothetical protein